jgi:hypothetical protein
MAMPVLFSGSSDANAVELQWYLMGSKVNIYKNML